MDSIIVAYPSTFGNDLMIDFHWLGRVAEMINARFDIL